MLKIQPSDTDLIKELVDDFGRNQQAIAKLIQEIDQVAKTDLDPIKQVKIKELRREMLVRDVKDQTEKIAIITKVRDEVCLIPNLQNV